MAFSFVFSLEIIITIIAVLILDNVSVSRFEQETSSKMENILMAELDS